MGGTDEIRLLAGLGEGAKRNHEQQWSDAFHGRPYCNAGAAYASYKLRAAGNRIARSSLLLAQRDGISPLPWDQFRAEKLPNELN